MILKAESILAPILKIIDQGVGSSVDHDRLTSYDRAFLHLPGTFICDGLPRALLVFLLRPTTEDTSALAKHLWRLTQEH